MKFHHVGLATNNVKSSADFIRQQCRVCSYTAPIYDALQDATVQLFSLDDGTHIELVAGSAVAQYVQCGQVSYHTCYEVEDIFSTLDMLVQQGAVLVSSPKPAVLFDHRLVAFLNTPMGLIELLESDIERAPISLSLNIAGSFNLEPFKLGLKQLGVSLGLDVVYQLAPHQQVLQSLLDPQSIFYQQPSNANCILLRLKDWVADEAGRAIDRLIIDAVAYYQQHGLRPLLVVLCPEEGVLCAQETRSLIESLKPFDKVAVHELLECDFNGKLLSSSEYSLAQIPYDQRGYLSLGFTVLRQIRCISQRPYKVVIVDADYTLWDGACAELGGDGITLSAGHVAFQAFLKDLKAKGFLLCLCSKNNEEDIVDVFSANPHMPLKLEDFVAMRINWHDKSKNISDLAGLLDLGLDSFIFVDDNPLECAEVLLNLPDVLVVNLTESKRVNGFFRYLWAFDGFQTSQEDASRTVLYRDNAKRNALKATLTSLRDFVAALHLELDIHACRQDETQRVKQLCMRTNQFRFNSDLQQSYSDGVCCVTVTAKDRFGDYGLIGAAFYQTDEQGDMTIFDLMISCRVLGRGIEHELMKYLAAQIAPAAKVLVRFKNTERNIVAMEFLSAIPHQKAPQGFRYDVGRLKTLSYGEQSAKCAGAAQKSVKTKAVVHHGRNLVLLRCAEFGFYQGQRLWVERKQVSGVAASEAASSLKEIFCRYLQREQVEDSDNFFSCGGTSLAAVSLLTEINLHYQVQLSLGAFYNNPTIAQLEAIIQSGQDSKVNSHLPQVEGVRLREEQLGIWFWQRLFPDSVAYNMPMVYRVEPALDVEKLKRAIAVIIRLTPSLRTAYVDKGGVAVAILQETVESVVVQRHQCETQSEADALIVSLTYERFELDAPPLLRVAVIEVHEGGQCLLFLLTHHINFDGVSYRLFNDLLSHYYISGDEGAQPSSNALLRPVRESGGVRDFWQGYLSQVHRVSLPYRQQQMDFSGKGVYFPVQLAGHAKLRQIAAANQTSSFNLYLVLFMSALTSVVDEHNFPIGIVYNDRATDEQSIIDNFARVLPFVVRQSDCGLAALLKQNHKTLANVLSYTQVSNRVLHELLPERGSPLTPVFDVVFSFHQQSLFDLALPEHQVDIYSQTYNLARFNVVFEVIEESPEHVLAGIYYNAEVLDELFVMALVDSFKAAVAEAVAGYKLN